jgi:hypothetical protein
MQRQIGISSVDRQGGREHVHIEAPGCNINITAGLRTDKGQAVTRISVDAHGDRYEEKWWCPDLAERGLDPQGIGVRVVQMDSKPQPDAVSDMEAVLQDAALRAGWNEHSQRLMLLRYMSAGRPGSLREFLEEAIAEEERLSKELES